MQNQLTLQDVDDALKLLVIAELDATIPGLDHAWSPALAASERDTMVDDRAFERIVDRAFDTLAGLTPRRRLICTLLSRGMTQAQIARHLGITGSRVGQILRERRRRRRRDRSGWLLSVEADALRLSTVRSSLAGLW